VNAALARSEMSCLSSISACLGEDKNSLWLKERLVTNLALDDLGVAGNIDSVLTGVKTFVAGDPSKARTFGFAVAIHGRILGEP
jgi:hypothetical protein